MRGAWGWRQSALITVRVLIFLIEGDKHHQAMINSQQSSVAELATEMND